MSLLQNRWFHESFSFLDDTIYHIYFCGFLIQVFFVFWIIVWILPKRLRQMQKWVILNQMHWSQLTCLICNRSYRGREVLPRNHLGGEGSCYRLRNLRRNNNKNKIKLRSVIQSRFAVLHNVQVYIILQIHVYIYT